MRQRPAVRPPGPYRSVAEAVRRLLLPGTAVAFRASSAAGEYWAGIFDDPEKEDRAVGKFDDHELEVRFEVRLNPVHSSDDLLIPSNRFHEGYQMLLDAPSRSRCWMPVVLRPPPGTDRHAMLSRASEL